MSKCRDLIVAIVLTATLTAGSAALAGPYGLGRPALTDEIAAWDHDVRPDGTGLPPGSGSVEAGEALFSERCAACHGDFAEGVDNWPALSGGQDTLDHDDPVKTVGSYWPYLSTLWDYIHRSKPYGNAQTLATDEVYALVAFLLYSNDLVDEKFVLTQGNFLTVEMPNAGGFIIDDRAQAEYPAFSRVPCMERCKDNVQITTRAGTLDVTPQSQTPEPPQAVPPPTDPALLAAGEKVFRKCKSCHQVGEGAKTRIGPVLTGIVDAPAGVADGYRYSKPMQAAGKGGLIWTSKELAAFLTKPKSYMKGTKMSFSGLRKKDDIAAVIAYLTSFSG